MAIAEARLTEYLGEIRERVCKRCVERPPGGPPCAAVGKNCGVELHLPELIESIHDVHSDMLAPYLEHNRAEVCEHCAFLHSSICPCPMDYLSALIVEAVEAVDDRYSDTALTVGPEAVGLPEIRQAYLEGKGTWTGCDWPTELGLDKLDLQGWQSTAARQMAEEARGTAAEAQWQAAASWLAQVEVHARQAEMHAAAAVEAAAAGKWHEAVRFAEQAWALEFGSGRAVWHSFPLAWPRLLRIVQAAFLTHRTSE